MDGGIPEHRSLRSGRLRETHLGPAARSRFPAPAPHLTVTSQGLPDRVGGERSVLVIPLSLLTIIPQIFSSIIPHLSETGLRA